MSTYTLLEYADVTRWGEPVDPPINRETVSYGSAKKLNGRTVYVRVLPATDACVRISRDGAAATSIDELVVARFGGSWNVYDAPYIYVVAA